jgi:hypothetical protein
MVGGWLLTYFCNHAIGHWAVGRLVGIRFLGYGVHGTTAPGWYPPEMRWVFGRVPLLSAWTDPASRRAAHPLARMLMYLGGPLFTGLTSLGIPLYGRASGVPRARALLIGATLWLIPGSVAECIRPGGDLRRAWHELRLITNHRGYAAKEGKMSEERPRHPQELAEDSEVDVGTPGAERSDNGEGEAEDVGGGARPSGHPEEPAEGAEEDVEAPGAERSGDRDG